MSKSTAAAASRAALCESTCPAVFRIADDGLAEVFHQPSDGAEQAGAQEAADNCPVSVIHVS